MSFSDSLKELSTAKKVFLILIICCIGVVAIAMITGGLSSDKNTASTNNNASTSNGNNSTVYGDGTYKVGTDLPAGEYKFTQTDAITGYIQRSSDSSMESSSIISNDLTNEKGETMYVTVKEGEYLKINGGEIEKI